MKSKTVLLIEPNRSIRENLKNSLEAIGDKVFIAKDEDEALGVLKGNEIDVIIIEPLLNTDFLSNKKEFIRNVLSGGTGAVLISNIRTAYRKKFDTIFYTVVSASKLFAISPELEDVIYIRKPQSTEFIILVVHSEGG
ncbi:MAG: response regulator [Patescibacteria group bacterium]